MGREVRDGCMAVAPERRGDRYAIMHPRGTAPGKSGKEKLQGKSVGVVMFNLPTTYLAQMWSQSIAGRPSPYGGGWNFGVLRFYGGMHNRLCFYI